jgi:hypothetical protein
LRSSFSESYCGSLIIPLTKIITTQSNITIEMIGKASSGFIGDVKVYNTPTDSKVPTVIPKF